MNHEFTREIGSRKLIFTINDWAMQASSSVLAQYGDTVVLATVTQSENPRAGIDYLPLLVEYDERFYAGGKIGGSRFIRREGRPSDEAIITARMIDRSIRPLLDSRERRDVQIIVTVLSFDKENDPDVVALLATSLALSLSPVAFAGPIGAARLGLDKGKFFVNPTYEEREKSALDLIVSGKEERIIMVEAKAFEAPEETIKKTFREAGDIIKELVGFQEEIIRQFAKQKLAMISEERSSALVSVVSSFSRKRLNQALFKQGDIEVKKSLEEIKRELLITIQDQFGENILSQANALFYEEVKKLLKEQVLKNGIRPDGRKTNELRSIHSSVDVLPRTHGSALFMRGMTHALSIVTLGAPGEERWIDGMETEEKQRYMHHYNFPPFSVGEVRPLRGPSRRDLGHGYLAQRALEPVLPSVDEFPYTIRVVTEILSSNGSSSMASACGSSLALMDAGVPITRPVAGIAMGLLYESEDHFKILTDIQGPEDQEGEMDFKIAGTSQGITALQMDVKLEGVPFSVLNAALDEARIARLEILDIMARTISKPRSTLSPIAPRVTKLIINPLKIRFVIGPGGEMINDIIAKTGTKIDIENDGTIFITAPDEAAGLKAKDIIEQITREYKEGDIVTAKISRITDFGAFAEIAPGKEGLIHISELADRYVKDANEVVSIGGIVEARVIGVDREGKIRLSLKKQDRLMKEEYIRRGPHLNYGTRTK